jgi:hypothetical protein
MPKRYTASATPDAARAIPTTPASTRIRAAMLIVTPPRPMYGLVRSPRCVAGGGCAPVLCPVPPVAGPCYCTFVRLRAMRRTPYPASLPLFPDKEFTTPFRRAAAPLSWADTSSCSRPNLPRPLTITRHSARYRVQASFCADRAFTTASCDCSASPDERRRDRSRGVTATANAVPVGLHSLPVCGNGLHQNSEQWRKRGLAAAKPAGMLLRNLRRPPAPAESARAGSGEAAGTCQASTECRSAGACATPAQSGRPA